MPTPPLDARPGSRDRRPAGRRLGRDLAVGASIAAGVPPGPLGAVVLLGCRDRGGRGLALRSPDPVDRLADARRRADTDPAQHDLLRGRRRRDRPTVPGPPRHVRAMPPTGWPIAIVLHMRPVGDARRRRRSRSCSTVRPPWMSAARDTTVVQDVREGVVRDIPARRVRSAFPRRDRARGRGPSRLPERSTAA